MPESCDNASLRGVAWSETKEEEALLDLRTRTCECGCGQAVSLRKGKPSRFKQGHNSVVAPPNVRPDNIPIEDFRRAVRKLKNDKGWTWVQMAVAASMSDKHLYNLMGNKIQKSVQREWATDFFRRLAGLGAPPTKYAVKVGRARERAENALIHARPPGQDGCVDLQSQQEDL